MTVIYIAIKPQDFSELQILHRGLDSIETWASLNVTLSISKVLAST